MTRTKHFFLNVIGLATLLCGIAGVQYAAVASAANITDPSVSAAKNSACAGIGGTTGASGLCTTTGPSLQNTITSIVNILSVLVGIAAVIMVIIGGFKYITSGGDSGSVSGAKNTIVYAVIGLVIVALAQFFVQFVLNKVTS